MIWSDEQQSCMDACISGKNVFITGGAGVGKSEVVYHIRDELVRGGKNVIASAPTGIAAIALGGFTLHSLMGLSIEPIPVTRMIQILRKRKILKERWAACDVLIIDEISMVDAGFFYKCGKTLQAIKNSTRPFGMQVIVVGDFAQLPPVQKVKKDGMATFAFQTALWQAMEFQTIHLTTTFRQKNEVWIGILNRMRFGKNTPKDFILLEDRISDSMIAPHIYPVNCLVDSLNQKELDKITSPTHSFKAESVVLPAKGNKVELDKMKEYLEKNCLAPMNLDVKIGAQVMLLINLDLESGLGNGSRGTVSAIEDDYILVTFGDKSRKVERHTWSIIDIVIGKTYYIQFPLRLSYAFTVHKSQGQSLDGGTISMKNMFEMGHAYVAFSRIRALENLCLLDFYPKKIKCHEEVLYFYENDFKPRKILPACL